MSRNPAPSHEAWLSTCGIRVHCITFVSHVVQVLHTSSATIGYTTATTVTMMSIIIGNTRRTHSVGYTITSVRLHPAGSCTPAQRALAHYDLHSCSLFPRRHLHF